MVMVPPSEPPGHMPDRGRVARCPKCGNLVRPRSKGQYFCRNCGTKFPKKESENIEPDGNDIL
jgi:tRNA(Ile2) C34 agmatinyltransferase TiaS